MFEITWDDAIEIAQRRRDSMNGAPLYAMFNGAKGDFDSLRTLGMLGRMEEDIARGEWYIHTGFSKYYMHSGATVWVG